MPMKLMKIINMFMIFVSFATKVYDCGYIYHMTVATNVNSCKVVATKSFAPTDDARNFPQWQNLLM